LWQLMVACSASFFVNCLHFCSLLVPSTLNNCPSDHPLANHAVPSCCIYIIPQVTYSPTTNDGSVEGSTFAPFNQAAHSDGMLLYLCSLVDRAGPKATMMTMNFHSHSLSFLPPSDKIHTALHTYIHVRRVTIVNFQKILFLVHTSHNFTL
jgi:hypothetical protein